MKGLQSALSWTSSECEASVASNCKLLGPWRSLTLPGASWRFSWRSLALSGALWRSWQLYQCLGFELSGCCSNRALPGFVTLWSQGAPAPARRPMLQRGPNPAAPRWRGGVCSTIVTGSRVPPLAILSPPAWVAWLSRYGCSFAFLPSYSPRMLAPTRSARSASSCNAPRTSSQRRS